MTRFNLDRIKNPVNSTVTVDPDGLGPITFVLAPTNTDTAFDVFSLRGAANEADFANMQFRIGVKRIVGWTDLMDEEGNLIPYSVENLGFLLNSPDFIPYAMNIGQLTINEIETDAAAKKKAPQATAPSVKSTKTKAATPEA